MMTTSLFIDDDDDGVYDVDGAHDNDDVDDDELDGDDNGDEVVAGRLFIEVHISTRWR